MRKNGMLHNMVQHLGDSVKLKPNAKVLLGAISWKADGDGRLRDKHGHRISFASCGKEWDVTGTSLTRALRELEEKGLIYCLEGGSGGLMADKIEHLYHARRAKIFGIVDDGASFSSSEPPPKIGGTPQNRGHPPKWRDPHPQNGGADPPKWGDIYRTDRYHPPSA